MKNSRLFKVFASLCMVVGMLFSSNMESVLAEVTPDFNIDLDTETITITSNLLSEDVVEHPDYYDIRLRQKGEPRERFSPVSPVYPINSRFSLVTVKSSGTIFSV